jgi:hypothetical protein
VLLRDQGEGELQGLENTRLSLALKGRILIVYRGEWKPNLRSLGETLKVLTECICPLSRECCQ